MEKEYYRPDEVAKKLGICLRTVYNLIGNFDNPLPCVKIGKQQRIKASDLEDWLKKQIKIPWD